jgi:hypothetical protein
MANLTPNSPAQPGSVPAAPAAPGQPQPVVHVQAPPGVVAQPAATPPAPAPTPATSPYADAPSLAPHPDTPVHPETGQPLVVYIYSHSNFFYWWPVWVVGFIMALLTRMNGELVTIGNAEVWIHPSKDLGVVFTLTVFLVIIITNVTLRGLSSVVTILAVAFTILLLAYFEIWGTVLGWLGLVSIYMNVGFYVFFSTLIFLVWAFSVFIYDRLSYWKVKPGQITHEAVIGGAEKSYDTRGMVFEKHREDLFRHWVLGLGSGDIQISTTGARRETVYVPNVLFVDSKINEIQRLIAMKPTEFAPPPA